MVPRTGSSKPEDITNFLNFINCWIFTAGEYHSGEEGVFPVIEKLTGIKEIMDKNILEYHKFRQGLE